MIGLILLRPDVLATIIVVTTGLVLLLVWLTVRAHHLKVSTGVEGIIGQRGIYKGDGRVFVHGELWSVTDSAGLEKGDTVEVLGVEGLKLKVVKTAPR